MKPMAAAGRAGGRRALGHAHALALGAGAALLDLAVVLLAGVVLDIYAPTAGASRSARWMVLACALPVVAPMAAAVWLRPRGAAQAEPVWTAAAMVLSPSPCSQAPC